MFPIKRNSRGEHPVALKLPLLPYSSPRGGGGTLIFSHKRRLSPLFWFKILNFNIFGGFQKNEYFLGCEDFVDIFFGGHHKIGLVWGSFLCNLGSFFKVKEVKVQN